MLAASLLFGTLFGSVCLASPADIHRSLRNAVDRPLPAPEEVMGVAPRRAPLGLAIIGNPEGEDRCPTTSVGRAIGTVLRTEIWGTTRALSFEAPMTYWAASEPTATPDGLTRVERIGRRVGARWVVQGSLAPSGTDWNVTWSIVDAEHPQATRTVKTVLRPAQANADLAATLRTLLEAMGARPDPDQADRLDYLAGYSNDAFAALVNAYEGNCESEDAYAQRVAAARDTFPSYAALALMQQQALRLEDRAARRAALGRILTGAGSHPIVGIYLNEALTGYSPRGEGQAELPALRALVARYPHQPAAIYALSAALYNYSALYADAEPGRRAEVVSGPIDHPARYAEAIALAGRAVELWPRDYKSWWMLAEATNFYAQAIRGTCFWDCVPPGAKARLPSIYEAFDAIVTEGLRAYPAAQPLLAAQIVSQQQMGRDWWPSFTLAVQQRPHAYGVYKQAMIYSGEGWGGDAKQRRQVYELAARHNPGEDWPLLLYVDWAPWSETWGVRYGHWLWLAVILLAAGFGYRWYRARRST
jgi:tetratricopeptide (TPR) repeat protein